jgi:hypothetical protein
MLAKAVLGLVEVALHEHEGPCPPSKHSWPSKRSGEPTTHSFADIGTSVYYTPGILYGQVGTRAALFVAMTLVVFVLLTVKYAEVAVRYPGGGGVVTVASRALHPFAGLPGGLFILVDYFLTAALSALSGLIYMSVVAPGLKGVVLPLTVAALVALGILNLVGISASAVVSARPEVRALPGSASRRMTFFDGAVLPRQWRILAVEDDVHPGWDR